MVVSQFMDKDDLMQGDGTLRLSYMRVMWLGGYRRGPRNRSWTKAGAVIDHTGIGVADVSRSSKFYDATLSALGLRRVRQIPDNVGTDGVGYGVQYPVFWIDRYHPHSVKQHTAFVTRSRAEVMRSIQPPLARAGLTNGASGLHRPNYYAAFVFDPDGNNIEAIFRGD
jgi:catechol 2,3-dioxygenase-like lactoylglutathione lyase family enzyme